MALYRSNEGVFENRLTVADVMENVSAYPRTLLIGASRDLLVTSSHAVFTALRKRDFDVHLRLYDARHGFFGFPPAWTFGAWKSSAQPAARLMVAFLHSQKDECMVVDGCSCCVDCKPAITEVTL